MRSQHYLTSAVLALFTFFMGSAQVLASTPDGETPANEGVCDVLIGSTPGLYGLCNAYCEAQDLDMFGEQKGSNPKILANYRKKMQSGDPDMPCLAPPPCECWTQEEANAAALNGVCNFNTEGTYAEILSSSVRLNIDTSRPSCRYRNAITRERRDIDPMAAEEAPNCYSFVVNACAAVGQ